jgi:hypothetical protein
MYFQKWPAWLVGVQVVDDHLARARVVQAAFNIVEAGDAVALGHIQGALVKDDAVG